MIPVLPLAKSNINVHVRVHVTSEVPKPHVVTLVSQKKTFKKNIPSSHPLHFLFIQPNDLFPRETKTDELHSTP